MSRKTSRTAVGGHPGIRRPGCAAVPKSLCGQDHGALLGYEQWADADAVPADARARTFYRRLSVITDGEQRVPRVIAFAEIDVDDAETAQVMLDTVTQALAADSKPYHPWGISATCPSGRLRNTTRRASPTPPARAAQPG
ncbi:hypothetical protein [Streptomyces syringium]|uniref:Antibiotic biosynthesis monooxygenase n=1 Tax=Streptomyces syringium TaxID=76729 RepID=A0ABS4XXI3_9ACTN|nr:hypothetical protein [Streptomyces syringium]MBP2401100.1 hypothetical protein [Streptomyces syringium]